MGTRKGNRLLPRGRSHGEKEAVKMAMSPFRRGGGGFWDPLSEVNRMFDDVFGGLMRRPGGQQRTQQLTEWAPAVDVLQRDGDLVVRAELPGVRPEDVDITLQNRVLTISGERREEQEEERGGYYVRERRRGSFSRSMTLPEGVDEDRIRARYDNGVLEVTIEGAAAVREPRRIQIEGAAGESPGAPRIGTEGTRPESPGGATGPGAEGTRPPEGPGGTVR
jgi:HSP20 family protein